MTYYNCVHFVFVASLVLELAGGGGGGGLRH